jgi:ATP-dependent DNA ligase
MLKAFDFCFPTSSTTVPSSPDWLHEVKHDGYRLRLERDSNRVRLITRNGHDWSHRFPWIVESALKNRQKHFVIDGEAVVLGVDGVPDFNALHSRKHDEEVQLYAFDVLALDGEDLRNLPLTMRKTNLARRSDGIFVAEFEQGEQHYAKGECSLLNMRSALVTAAPNCESGARRRPPGLPAMSR